MSSNQSEIHDGQIIYGNQTRSDVVTIIKKNQKQWTLSSGVQISTGIIKTIIKKDQPTIQCPDDLAYIILRCGLTEIHITEFYVSPQTPACQLQPDERKRYKGIGEVIFINAFRHAYEQFYRQRDPEKINVTATVMSGYYQEQNDSCRLLDLIYYQKYHFKSVRFNCRDQEITTDLNPMVINQCYLQYGPEHCMINIKTDLKDLLKRELAVSTLWQWEKI